MGISLIFAYTIVLVIQIRSASGQDVSSNTSGVPSSLSVPSTVGSGTTRGGELKNITDPSSSTWRSNASDGEGHNIGSPIVKSSASGEEAHNTDYPFMVSIQLLETHYCDGTLIKEDWVLTAAHCLVDASSHRPLLASYFLVVAGRSVVEGSHTITDDGRDITRNSRWMKRAKTLSWDQRKVADTYVHLFYNIRYDFNNDIGLMQLSKGFRIGRNIQLAKLAPSIIPYTKIREQSCKVFGWGQRPTVQIQRIPTTKNTTGEHISETSNSVSITDVNQFTDRAKERTKDESVEIDYKTDPFNITLKVFDVTVRGAAACDKLYEEVEIVSQVCVSGTPGSACFGNSGGPMICNRRQIGILSQWANPNASGGNIGMLWPNGTVSGVDCSGIPIGLYTRVDYYLDWIEAITSGLEYYVTAPRLRSCGARVQGCWECWVAINALVLWSYQII